MFTNETVCTNRFVFFVTNFETTALTVSYCLYELAKNPEIRDELRRKIKQTKSQNEGKLSYNFFNDLLI